MVTSTASSSYALNVIVREVILVVLVMVHIVVVNVKGVIVMSRTSNSSCSSGKRQIGVIIFSRIINGSCSGGKSIRFYHGQSY